MLMSTPPSSNFQKIIRSNQNEAFTFSIIIPSYNNLTFLEKCIESIKKNSLHNNQIIIAVNEGSDGTVEWINTSNHIDAVIFTQNVGVCLAVNAARTLVQSNYIVYANDDMYMLPKWDDVFLQEINSIGHNYFYLSGTMIEPIDTGNPCVVVADYGNSLETFQEENLLKNLTQLKRNDWQGATWPPSVMHRDIWDLIGGFGIEFSPGMYSDPDISMKLWLIGVRLFKGCGNSLVYHFGSKTTKRIKVNNGAALFFLKWGIGSSTFTKKIIKRGDAFENELSTDPVLKENFLKSFQKKITALIKYNGIESNSFWNRFKS
jgi:glycosyltransferase involved in cell wall biosynthesis